MKYIMHVSCWATGFGVAEPIPDKRAVTVAQALLERAFLLFGYPIELRSDRGSEYVNEILRSITTDFRIKHKITAPYSPQGNARTENPHRWLSIILRILCNEYRYTWPFACRIGMWALNGRPGMH